MSVLQLPMFEDKRGCLSIIEENQHIPFEIAYVEWHSVNNGLRLDYYNRCNRALVALSGRMSLIVADETSSNTFELSNCYSALYVPAGLSVNVTGLSDSSNLLLLASRDIE